MRLQPWKRLVQEVGLGILALAIAIAVLVPALWAVNAVFRTGEYNLLIGTVVAGVLLLLYQVRLRPTLREPTMRAAAGLAEALRGNGEQPPSPSAAAFRVWGGVPIAALRVSVHEQPDNPAASLAPLLCAYVRDRAAATGALSWALSEVGGNRLLLVQEPEQPGEPEPMLSGALAASRSFEETFHHLWSANGPASYDEPVAFATVVIGQAVAAKEAELHGLSVQVAERVAQLADISGVEVLMSATAGTGSPYVLWLAAGRTRAARRQVYLALEPASATQGLAWTMDRYDLLACDAYATPAPMVAPDTAAGRTPVTRP